MDSAKVSRVAFDCNEATSWKKIHTNYCAGDALYAEYDSYSYSNLDAHAYEPCSLVITPQMACSKCVLVWHCSEGRQS